MELSTTINGQVITITTDHAASSYGNPVVLIDAELTDIQAQYAPDECECNVLDLLANAAGIWGGGQTRRELRALADEMLGENPTGVNYDAVITEFARRGAELEKRNN